MAGKAKSCYLSVYDRGVRKTVLYKVFFNMADLNAFVKTEEFVAKYPIELFDISKEVY
jgi:hypothetical protein